MDPGAGSEAGSDGVELSTRPEQSDGIRRVVSVVRHLIPSFFVLPLVLRIVGSLFVLRPVQVLQVRNTAMPMVVLSAAYFIVPLYQRFRDAWKTCLIAWGGVGCGLLLGYLVSPAVRSAYPSRGVDDISGIVIHFTVLGGMASLCAVAAAAIHRIVCRIRVGPRPLFRGSKWLEAPAIVVAGLLLHALSNWRTDINDEFRRDGTRFINALRRQDCAEAEALLDKWPQLTRPVTSPVVGDDSRSRADPVYVAARSGNRDLVTLLLSRGAVPTISAACVADDSALLESILSRQKEFPDDRGALHDLVKARCYKYIPILIKNGADPNHQIGPYNGNTQLIVAAKQKDAVAIRVLVGAGANPNHHPRSDSGPHCALKAAVDSADEAVIHALLDAGAQIDEYVWTDSMLSESTGVLELLLGSGRLPSETAMKRANEILASARDSYANLAKHKAGVVHPTHMASTEARLRRLERAFEMIEVAKTEAKRQH
ncbi:MAG: ankyrin repeat domain-containing protein [Planctomycetota bacterium]|jgi:hypothetical protein